MGMRSATLITLVAAVGLSVAIEPYDANNYDHRICYSTKRGREYIGTESQTADGITCQRWDTDNAPHDITVYNNWDFPEGSTAAAENYCRNPSNDGGGPWCYTSDPNIRWQYCDVPSCFGYVDSVEPRLIGNAGGVRVTLRGKGFAKNQFAFGEDSHVGNRVWLVNEYESKECAVFVEGSNEEMITCITPSNMYDDQWSVRLAVDGVHTPTSGICNGHPFSWTCSVRSYPWYSPYIEGVVPRSGEPDGIITIYGRFFTDAYGSNFGDASNGKSQKILRVYVGGYACELKNGDDFYGTLLTRNDDGYIKCKISRINERGLSANYNVSVIIEAPYGQTYAKSTAYHVSATSSLSMYQSYAVIDSISPSVGSTAGGQLITITGDFFDETKAPAEVMVGDDECVVESITDTEIMCRTPEQPADTPSSYPGNRGVQNDYFEDGDPVWFDNLEDLFNVDTQQTSFWSDGAYWCEGEVENNVHACQVPEADKYNVRSRGYFVPRQSGDYRFYIKSDDWGKLFFSYEGPEENKTMIASASTYTTTYVAKDEQESDRFALDAGKAYYMEYLAGEWRSGGNTYIGAKFYNNSHLYQTVGGKVQPEVQSVQISSVENTESLRLTLTDLSTTSATQEVQTVEMTYSDTDGVWQLGMRGVYTDILDVDTSAIDLEKAINDLPSVYPDTVLVTSTDVTSGRTYTVTFRSELGDWPAFTEISSGGASVSVSDDTDGTASLSEWRLHLSHDGSDMISDMISSIDPTTDDISAAVESLFSARCPRSTGYSAYGKKFYESYESSDSSGFFGGYMDYASEPFCGRGSGMNVARIFHHDVIDVSNGGHVCFAYRGILKPFMRFEMSSNQRWSYHLYPDVDFPQDEDTAMDWKYICVDILEVFEASFADDTGYSVKSIEVYREPYNDIWVDEVVIAGRATTENPEVLVSDRRIPLTARVETVAVNGTSGSFDIKIRPHNCANTFEMMQVLNAPRLSGSTGTGASAVTWGDDGTVWPADAEITIDRSESASVPVTGTWELTDGTSTITLDADMSERDIMSRVALDMNLADVKITKSGTCYGYNYDLEWTQTSGDLPALAVGDGSGLEGNSPEISVVEIDGHVFYDPVPGDMIVTREENPQVRVTINNIKAKCRDECSYEWNSDNTPEFTDVTPTSGSSGTTLVITGAGFSATAAENMVRIGSADCDVTDAAVDEITCTLGAGSLGDFTVEVYTPDGLAVDGGSFTYEGASVDSISPDSGSVAGGTLVEATGSGFNSSTEVYIGGALCEITFMNATTFHCMTSEGSDGEANTYISTGGVDSNAAANFTYSMADSPNITDITPASVSVAGGETLTVTGVQFGDVYEDITLSLVSDSDEVIVLMINETTASDTNLEAELPSLPHGNWSVRVRVDNIGYANDVSGVVISVVLRMDAISTQIGSMEGGTRLIIAGEGFGTDSDDVEVMIGSSECDVDSITNENITCYTGRGSNTVTVTNGGIDPKFGLGYAWKPSVAEIKAGDYIKFVWTSPMFLTTNNFAVMEVFSPDAEYNGTGFMSEDASPSGSFEHQFNTPGTYYYTSGIVGANQDIELRGKIIVGNKEAIAANVSVMVHGQEAEHNTGSGVSITETVDCDGTADAISGRSDTDPSSGYDFEFVFSTNYTPYFTDIDVSQGYIDTNITITGEGFSTTDCDNEVMIGEYRCNSIVSTDTEIVCNMDAGEEPDVGISFSVTVRVNNRGDPVVFANETTFALLPSMDSVEPNMGSLNGGTSVNITGAGFVGVTEVMLGLTSCNIVYQSYTLITCVTDASAAANNSVTVTVTNSYNQLLPVECTTEACWFEFSEDATPSLDVVDSPASIENDTSSLVVNGTGLGSDTDDITVYVGDAECDVTDVSDDQVTCDIGCVAAGSHDITAVVAGKGRATGVTITADLVVDSVSPDEGSIWGGQEVTISGVGFDADTTVTLNDVDCAVSYVNCTMVVCLSGASSEGIAVTVAVTTSSASDDSKFYNYTTDSTPTVTDIDPVDGAEGDEITITGTGFSTTDADNTVMIGAAECAVTSSSATEIICDLGGSVPGTVSTVVNVDGVGKSDSDTDFTYLFTPGQLSPATGSFGGLLNVSLAATGVVAGVTVTVCDIDAEIAGYTATSVNFLSPVMDDMFSGGDLDCDVVVTVGDSVETMSAAFTYQTADTAQIDEVSPARGGTKGGTVITITGSNFGGNGENEVTVAGAVCDIDSESATEIICETNEPAGGSQKTNVVVQVQDKGVSLLDNSDFWYVDAWSSNFTWGGNAPPGEGELVVVPEGQLLLLDESTPVLKMLLIMGGELLFDEVDLTLRAENILIVRGGRLTVGTEDAPFQHDATIEMHGQLRAQELPIYGAKCLAIREGELNLHGKPIRMTWTRLAATASAGATEIELEWGQLDWPVGSTIVIATTGDRHSQAETETRVITAVNSDGTVLTLDEALGYDHLGVTEELGGGYTLEMRAEVGLLSRNVRVIGARDTQWSDDIEACPEGFDTGEFTTQTCFQGRFGDEVGSDQFGAQIMFHAPFPDQQLVVGKLSYMEVNYAGQAFRLGRYPVHFHLNGDMNGSYVRGLAIHETFNRAINVHGTHNMLVEHTVIHNVMGGALFLEDGIETGNSYYYNLALFVKASSSLLNDDITPAAFWATNPANNYEHNAAAGGTHFGWWWRMEEHPTGPSATTSYCPQKVPLGIVYNNTVHSQGWFGLWTFQDYFPMVGGGCDGTEPEPAKFNKFIVWNCDKGLEFVNGGALQFHDSMLVNNRLTGLEGKKNMLLGPDTPYTDRAPMLNNSVIAAYAPNYPVESTGRRYAVILPWSEGFVIKDTVFINFDSEDNVVFRMTEIQGTCSSLCGGWNYHMEGLEFINGDAHIADFRWDHDGVFVDKDGSLSGVVGGNILPWLDSLDPSKCQVDDRFSIGDAQGAICDETTAFARMSFNKPNMDSMMFKDVIFTNEFGSHRAVFTDKRMTHMDGWTTVLELGQKYKFVWENLEHLVNMSYDVGFNDVREGGVILVHNMTSKPDRFQVISGIVNDMDSASPSQLSYDSNAHGDFYFDDNNKEISYMVSNIDAGSRKRRAVGDTFVTRDLKPHAYRCFWPNCDPPPDQNTLPPLAERPDYAVWWSDTATWPDDTLPTDDSDVTIDSGMWVVADVAFPRINKLILKGNLELDHEKDPQTNDFRDFTLEVHFLIIQGGRLVVGWEDNRFMGNVEIILHGTHNDEPYPQSSGTSIGTKAMAVYGGLDLHGRQRSPVQTYLAATAAAGDDSITVSSDVDWVVGEEITIATTTFDSHQTETHTISAISGRVITLSQALQYKHLGEVLADEAGNREFKLAAEVMLVTRNVVVRGGDYSDMVRLGYGGRILVSSMVDEEGNALTGWARVSYAQFTNMGQLGFAESFDARFAIAYSQTGPTSSIKPSYLKGNSFYKGFSPQIGMFGAEDLSIQDNCMYQTVGGGMVVTGNGFLVERNLIMHNLWPGSYEGRSEVKNVHYEGSFDLRDAGPITFRDNTAAGSERAGFRMHGEPCTGEEQPSTYENNKAHSAMFGMFLEEGDEISTVCFKIEDYTFWKNYHYGIWIQTPGDKIELKDNNLIENGLGVWTMTFAPASLSHDRTLNMALMTGGYVSGPTQYFDCDVDKMPDDTNYQLSYGNAKSWRINGGTIGVAINNADSGPNNQPTHPFAGRMSYPLINGKHVIDGVTFANFGSRTCGSSTLNDFAITNNPASDDNTHPTYVSAATVETSVSKENLVYLHRSRARIVNPSDCVDMDCDGHKKTLVEDTDGSFLGAAGTIIDDAAYEWDGVATYGLGDYRIPKPMLTLPNNTRIDPPPNKGIYRGDDCTWHATWQAYECYGTVYRQVVIESMDADHEKRRLSPIGVKDRMGNWIDLLNGPQDHGWCAGYTCQLRISTFWAVMAIGHTYDVYLTGTNPQHTRFYILHGGEDESVRLAMYYFSPQRLDVFADDVYIYPTNAVIGDDGDYSLEPTTETPSEWLPGLDGGVGQNFFDREWQLQYLILRGEGVVDVIIKEVVMVSLSMPPMTIDDFFGENIVNNLAAFLGVPANKIRIVNVIRETSRKRETGGTTVEIEIGDPPSAGTNVTAVNGGDLDFDTLVNLTRAVVDAVQLGTLGSSLNLTILGIEVQEPLPAPENSSDSDWANLASGNSSSMLASIQIPARMEYHLPLAAEREQQPFPTQPEFAMYDANDDLVAILGSRADPWKIRATLRAGGSDANAELIGDTVCGFRDGICTFETLGISHSGSDYIIDFEIFDPASAPFSAVSESITVSGALLSAGFNSVPDKDTVLQMGETFTALVDIRDFTSGLALEDIAWKGHTWQATLSIYTPGMSPDGAVLSGTLTKTFDSLEGIATFDDLSLNVRGRYSLHAEVTSSPADYTLTGYSSVIEVASNMTQQDGDVSYNVSLKLDLNYDTVADGKEDLIEALVYNYLLDIDETARYDNFEVGRGSIYVLFWVTGEATDVTNILDTVQSDISSGLILTFPGDIPYPFTPFMTVDGVTVVEQELVTITTEGPEEGGRNIQALIIAASISSVLVIILIVVIIVLLVMKKKSNNKIGDSQTDVVYPQSRPASKTGHLDDLQITDGRLGRLSQAGSRPTSAAAGPRPESTTHGGTDRDAEHGQTPVQA